MFICEKKLEIDAFNVEAAVEKYTQKKAKVLQLILIKVKRTDVKCYSFHFVVQFIKFQT